MLLCQAVLSVLEKAFWVFKRFGPHPYSLSLNLFSYFTPLRVKGGGLTLSYIIWTTNKYKLIISG